MQGGLSENQLTLIETDEKNIELDSTGQSGSDINNHANKYKLSGEGLFFSNNGGQTWNVGVTPKGINADYIKVGSLDASKISIVDGEYLYFLWDKGGITAYRTPQATKDGGNYFQDFARFNKYGLSLVENGQIKLRAGYNYTSKNTETNGRISDEMDIDSNSEIGFYLYNDQGNAIFKAESTKNAYQSAQITLKGEIYTSDTVNYKEKGYENLKYLYQNAYIFDKYNAPEVIEEKNYKNTDFKNILSKKDFINAIITKWYNEKTDNKVSYITDDIYINYSINLMGKIKKADIYNEKDKTFYRVNTAQIKVQTSSDITEENKMSLKEKGDNYIQSFYNLSDCNEIVTLYFTENTDKSINICVTNDNFMQIFYLSANKPEKSLKATNTLSQESIVYLEKTVNSTNNRQPLPKKEITLYFHSESNTGYVNQSNYDINKDETVKLLEGETELYINNKVLLNENENENRRTTSQGDHRLFSCIRRNNEKIGNIFTIKKDGSLYFGGTVTDFNETGQDYQIDNDNTLKPCVTIKDEGIRITNDGKLSMDLTLFTDIKTGTPLMDIIADAVNSVGVASHGHKIEKINFNKDTCLLYGPKNKSEADALDILSKKSDAIDDCGYYLSKLFKGEKCSIPVGGTTSQDFKWTGRIPIGELNEELVSLTCIDTKTSTFSSGSNWSYNSEHSTTYKDWYWCGDSRTEGLINSTKVNGKAKVGAGVDTLKDFISNGLKNDAKGKNLVLWWGVNDRKVDEYIKLYKDLAEDFQGKIIVLTVGPVFNTSTNIDDNVRTIGEEGGGGTTTLTTFNKEINDFNKKLISDLSDIIVLNIDECITTLTKTYSKKDLAAGEGNGLHYSSLCYKLIEEWVRGQITVVDGSERAQGRQDVPKIFAALTSVGYDRNAALGILGNMEAESSFYSNIWEGGTYSSDEELNSFKTATDFANTYYYVDGDYKGYGFGLIQFSNTGENGNKALLFNKSKELGLPLSSILLQASVIPQSDPDAALDKMNNKTLEEAVKQFLYYVEVPANKEQKLEGRLANAQALINEFNL